MGEVVLAGGSLPESADHMPRFHDEHLAALAGLAGMVGMVDDTNRLARLVVPALLDDPFRFMFLGGEEFNCGQKGEHRTNPRVLHRSRVHLMGVFFSAHTDKMFRTISLVGNGFNIATQGLLNEATFHHGPEFPVVMHLPHLNRRSDAYDIVAAESEFRLWESLLPEPLQVVASSYYVNSLGSWLPLLNNTLLSILVDAALPEGEVSRCYAGDHFANSSRVLRVEINKRIAPFGFRVVISKSPRRLVIANL